MIKRFCSFVGQWLTQIINVFLVTIVYVLHVLAIE